MSSSWEMTSWTRLCKPRTFLDVLEMLAELSALEAGLENGYMTSLDKGDFTWAADGPGLLASPTRVPWYQGNQAGLQV